MLFVAAGREVVILMKSWSRDRLSQRVVASSSVAVAVVFLTLSVSRTVPTKRSIVWHVFFFLRVARVPQLMMGFQRVVVPQKM